MRYIKLFEYFTEDELEESEDSIELLFYSEILNIIENDCQKYINELIQYRIRLGRDLYKESDILYRGYKSTYKNDNIVELKSRDDRKPIGTNSNTHKAVGELSKEYFGWDMRSAGIFATSNIIDLQYYGTQYIFLPIGDYKFLYNENIDDLTRFFYKNKIDYNSVNVPGMNMVKSYKSFEDIKSSVKVIISEYTDKYLSKAIENKVEVSFKCDRYYLLNSKFSKVFMKFINNNDEIKKI